MKMKKKTARRGNILDMLAVGLLFTACSSMGTAYHNPPDGIYRSGHQGDIVFDGKNGTWEAPGMGYRGSFNYDTATSKITLTADQGLRGLSWAAIDPIPGFTGGDVKDGTVTLGNFSFYRHED
jgi:hypothetical protein